ncbi:MAG: NTP transferase domain-containing protein [Acidobacteriota bacterium]
MSSFPPLAAGLLIGGASRRFGRPKQLAEVAGVSLAEQAYRALAGRVGECVLLGAGPVPPALEALPQWPDDPAAEDLRGPLAAMLTAFRRRPDHGWIFAPCDHPAVRPEAVDWLISERRPARRAILPMTGDPREVQPLLALYEPSAAALLEDLAATGRHGPRALAEGDGVALLEPPTELHRCWQDIDTVVDLERYRREAEAPPAGEEN